MNYKGLLQLGGEPSAYSTVEQAVNNSTTFVATELTLPVKASTIYKLQIHMMITASTVSDFKWKLVVPSGTAASQCDGGVGSPSIERPHWDMTADATTAINTTGTVHMNLFGLIRTSSTAGDIVVHYAQVTAEVYNTTLHTGSHMTLKELGQSA